MRGRACERENAGRKESGGKRRYIKGEERSMDWGEWNRLQLLGERSGVGRQVEEVSFSLCLLARVDLLPSTE